MINENKSSYYPEKETHKQAVCSPYNELAKMRASSQHNPPHPRARCT